MTASSAGSTLVVALLASGCAAAPSSEPAPPPVVSATPHPTEPHPMASASAPPTMGMSQAFDTLCDGPDAVPLEIAGSRHFVNVTVKGPSKTETLRFHVDTGGCTPGILLDRSVAERLGVKSEADLPRSIRIGDRELALDEQTHWLVGDEKLERFERATRRDFSSGQLGAGFLSRYLVCIDPVRKKLGLAAAGSVHIDDPAHPPVPLMMQLGGNNAAKYPFLHVLIRNGDAFVGGYGMLLDTGATTSMLERGKIDHVSGKMPASKVVLGAAGDADMIGAKSAEPMLRVGGVSLTAPKVKFPDRPEIDAGVVTFVGRDDGTWNTMFGVVGPTRGSYGAIANDVLGRYRIILDYQRELAWFDPTSRPVDASASLSRVGLSLRFGDDGCPVVMTVSEGNTKATLAAIRPGDVLLTVDDLDACKAMHHEIQAALAGAPGDTRHLEIRRGKNKLTIAAVVAQLLPDQP